MIEVNLKQAVKPQVQPSRKVHVETWGCQMNVADSERMLALLAEQNYQVTHDGPEDADLIILNTCHIREKARHKIVSRLGVLRPLKDHNPGLKIAVAGCVAQAEGKKLMQAAPFIDLVLGPGKIDELPKILQEMDNHGEKTCAIGFAKPSEEPRSPAVNLGGLTSPISGKNEITRYVNIAQGCNNFCTFCVVPFTRGREVSRQTDDILQEVRGYIAAGSREIMLLGQNVNSYGHDLVEQGLVPTTETGPFVDLLATVAKVQGLERLRFTTSNPHDFTRPLAQLFSDEPKLGRYMHLPVQSGNDEVLKAMRRKVTVAEFHERVNWLREAVPDIALSTDIIVGFPGETEEQFEGTVELVQNVGFSFIFSFKYSPRKGTAAARFPNQIDPEVASRRLKRLNEVQDQISLQQQLGEIGKSREVLVQYESNKEPGVFYGRTEHFRLVRIPSGRPIVGQLVEVEIIDGNKTALVGRLI